MKTKRIYCYGFLALVMALAFVFSFATLGIKVSADMEDDSTIAGGEETTGDIIPGDVTSSGENSTTANQTTTTAPQSMTTAKPATTTAGASDGADDGSNAGKIIGIIIAIIVVAAIVIVIAMLMPKKNGAGRRRR